MKKNLVKKLAIGALSSVLALAAYYVYDSHKEKFSKLEEENKILSGKNDTLLRQFDKITLEYDSFREFVCSGDHGSVPQNVDCGKDFHPRYATCLCTTLCLEDYTVVVTNRQRCRDWPSAPIQVRPERENKNEEEEDE